MDQIVYVGEGKYSSYKVVDRTYNDRPARLLLAGKRSAPQSGIALDDNPELLFDYIQRLFEVVASLSPESVLIIGGGAFTLPQAIVNRLPKTSVDIVEIDKQLPRIARKYFGLKRHRRLRIFATDGRQYIESCRKQYDLIIVDAFSEYDIPHSLLTVQAANRYAELLTPGGTVAVNIISKYRGSLPTPVHRLMASFGKSFASISIYPADPQDNQRDEQNLIFIASRQQSPNLDYLLSVEVHPQILNDEQLELHDI